MQLDFPLDQLQILGSQANKLHTDAYARPALAHFSTGLNLSSGKQ
jgi:hypothetical protein